MAIPLGGPLELTALERASGLIAGPQPGVAPTLPPPDSRPAREVLEAVILRALQQRCFVSFSGGRDSSAVLATAVAVARREGLPLPVPITLRFPEVPSTDETEWQELVIRHLDIDDWERIRIDSELDLLGDEASRILRRHGLVWPPNAFFHAPMLRAAKGGCLLTGLDGDGLLGAWRWNRARSVLARRTRPSPKDLLRVGVAMAPSRLRRPVVARQSLPPITWLRPTAHQAFARLWVRETAAEPSRWDQRVAWYSGRRYLHLAAHALSLVAADHGAEVRHPLTDPGFLSALAKDGGTTGWGARTDAMVTLFGDLLPKAVIERPSKAEFGRALWKERARSFAAGWDGTGVDHDLIDPDRLRQAWAADNPVFASVTPLHSAWLATEVSRTGRGASSRPFLGRRPLGAG